MTAVQMNTLNSQIWRDMGIISENEGMMIRVAKYLRKVRHTKCFPAKT